MTRAVISLGSNLGDREAMIRDAVAAIAAVPGVELLAGSSIVESIAIKPEGADETAPRYLNAIVIVDSSLSPQALLAELNVIEANQGRTRETRWGDRTLDLDLVIVGDEVIESTFLTLPHPRAAERDFVLAPWLDADPEAVLAGARVRDLLASSGNTTTPYAAEPLA